MDLIIKNVTVLDGSGKDPYLADVGIADGKIAAIGADLSGAIQIIDGKGQYLSPGFIDSHSHADNAFLEHPEQREKLEQGITLSVTGQCGNSFLPKKSDDGIFKAGDFLKEANQNMPLGAGMALQIGHNSLRLAVMGTVNRAPTRDEMEEMKSLLRDGLENGAIGLSFGLFYTPGSYAETEECIELARVVKEYDGILSAHIRNESDLLLESVEEFLTIIKASGCRAVFSHHKAAGKENWGKVKESLAMIDEANRQGCDIYLDVYPYTASATTLKARFVPRQFHTPGITDEITLLEDPFVCEQIRQWGRGLWGDDLSFTLITSSISYPEYVGKNINEICAESGDADPYETVFRILLADHGTTKACFFTMAPDDVEYVLSHPRAMICTDSSVTKKTSEVYHPRLRAAFPRALAQYVREKKLLSFAEMIRRMTSLPASVYKLPGKGEIKVGMDADLVLFDPETISDQADYKNCKLPNLGLSLVLVDGKIVVENGAHNGICAARVYKK